MAATYIISTFILLSVIISALFFYMSSREHDEFIMSWGLSWIFYSLALLCFWMSIKSGHYPFMEIKKTFDMYAILSLLFGVYKFNHVKVPGYWFRFAIYLTVWVTLTTYFSIDMLPSSIPVFAFDLLMTGTICYVIIRYWTSGVQEKIFYCIVFILWGTVKGLLALYETGNSYDLTIYLGEILYANLLNVCIFVIYLRNIKQEMAKMEDRFQVIVENATDAIFYYEFNPHPKFLYITPSIEEISGYAPQVFYKNPRAILELVDGETFETINRLFFSGAETAGPTSEVFKIQRKNGAVIWVEMNVSLIREQEKTVAIEGIIRDITQMKEVQDDLTTSKQSRDLLLSYISHELKTPITSILGYVTAVKDGTISDEPERQKAMEIICQKSLILERMILDLFQLSLLETNQYSFVYEHMSCEELADYIHEHTLPDLKESGRSYRFSIDRRKLADLNMIADRVRINQVVTNLIANAIKHTTADETITISCSVDLKKEQMVISVSDRGSGIPEVDLPYVFDRFFQSGNPGASKSQGRGLGLALSKEIVQAHGGTIQVKSQYRKGSIFTVMLPLYDEED